MNPQEKLAATVAEMREMAAEMIADPGRPTAAVSLGDTLNHFADELTTLLSEHGGGGEAVVVETVGFIREDGDGDLYIDWTVEGGIHELGEGCELIVSATKLTDDTGAGEVYTTPPTPSAPVVDDAMTRLRGNRRLWRADLVGGEISVERMTEILTAALSGANAPVGVEETCQCNPAERYGCPGCGRCYTCHRKFLPTLTPPAAAPAASENIPSRSRLRRIATEKGEPAPRFDGSEDGLPKELERARDTLRAWRKEMPPVWYGNKALDAAASALDKAIRRLAASGQGVEWQPIATLPTDDTLILAGCADGRIMVYRADILARNIAGPTPEHLRFPADGWMPLPAAPTQEKGNG